MKCTVDSHPQRKGRGGHACVSVPISSEIFGSTRTFTEMLRLRQSKRRPTKIMHKMAAELKHFAAFGARFPKFTPILKENSRALGEYG